MERVRCPETAMATRSGTPARTMLRMAERRMSWKSCPVRPAASQAARPPRLAEVADGLAVAVEDQRAVEAPRARTALEQGAKLAAQDDHPWALGLAVGRPQADDPAPEIHVGPRERCHLALPPPGEIG